MTLALPPEPTLTTGRLLAVPPRVLDGRDSIDDFFDRLNRSSKAAERVLVDSGRGRHDSVRIASLQLQPAAAHGANASGITSVVETQTSVGVNMRTRDRSLAPPIYFIGLPLTGTLGATLTSGPVLARAGEGLLIDPAETEGLQTSPGAHYFEFNLPKRSALALGAELAPGAVGAAPRFVPLVKADLAQRLLFMVLQAAGSALNPGGHAQGRVLLSQRWSEMIALTLLQEQPLADAAPQASVVNRGPAPASLRRALEFIHAHVQRDLLMSEIAEAACVSASSLLRQFQDHLGLSPGAFVRQLRLDSAHAELRRGAPGSSVRSLALRWGFQNPSKFSQAYLRRFGEKPSDTRLQRR